MPSGERLRRAVSALFPARAGSVGPAAHADARRRTARRTRRARATIRALCLGLALVSATGAAQAADRLVLQLHAPAQFEFAGYYAALWNGYYRKAGLDVVIKPGAPPGATPIDPVREVTEGRAQFGTGTARLVIRAAQGLPLLLLAPIFQASGARVYYRADADLSTPGALLGGRIGRLPASNILDIELRTALIAEGIDPERLHSVPIEPGEAVAEFAKHRIDAVIGSSWRLPWLAREQGIALKSFDPAAYRPEFYGDGLFALQRFADAHPRLVARFRAASIKGWEYALLHPDEVASRIVAELPAKPAVPDPIGFARYQSHVARRLALYPGVPLGHSNFERWERIQHSMLAVAAMARPVELADFLYDPDAGARARTDRRAWTIVALAAAVVLLAAGGFLWHRRRRAAGGFESAGARSPRSTAAITAAIAEELGGVTDRIAGALEEIRRQAVVQPRLGRFCATALEALENLRAITARLLTMHGVPTAQPTDLNAMLTAIERTIRGELREPARFRLSLLPDAWLCEADADAVAAVVLDLVAVAAREMATEGELVIGTRQFTLDTAQADEMPGSAPGDYVRITVGNTGPGLAPDSLEHIFDPAATIRPAIAAAWQLTRALGGFARVESAEGYGTAVHLYFRRSPPAADAGKAAEPPPDKAKAAE